MKYSELTILHEDVSTYLAYVGVDASELDNILLESGINISSLDSDKLQNPEIVNKLKKQIKSANRWQTIIGIISKLNVLLITVTVGKGVATHNDITSRMDEYTIVDPIDGSEHVKLMDFGRLVSDENELSYNKKSTIVVSLIQLAISGLLVVVKRAMRDNSIDKMNVLMNQIDKSIGLYKKQLRRLSDSDKQKLQSTIDSLEELKKLIDDEKNVMEDRPGLRKS